MRIEQQEHFDRGEMKPSHDDEYVETSSLIGCLWPVGLTKDFGYRTTAGVIESDGDGDSVNPTLNTTGVELKTARWRSPM